MDTYFDLETHVFGLVSEALGEGKTETKEGSKLCYMTPLTLADNIVSLIKGGKSKAHIEQLLLDVGVRGFDVKNISWRCPAPPSSDPLMYK